MDTFLSFSFNNTLNSIKNILQSIPVRQQKIIGIVAFIFASVPTIYTAYHYCFKSKQNPPTYTAESQLPHVVPEAMAKLFQKYQYPLKKLPVLDMTKYPGSTDYIQYIKKEDMTSPVMRFKDATGRCGIALHIHGKNTTRKYFEESLGENKPASKINAVWTFHHRYLNNSTNWVSGKVDSIREIIDERHNKTDHKGNKLNLCRHCPIIGNGELMSASLLENLLTGKDPDFQLGETPNFNLFT